VEIVLLGVIGWRIAFATVVYFRRHGDEYSLSNSRLSDKERIGSF
jgi:hypothetical protein